MSRMIRKQVYITPEQQALLKRRAKALGVSEAELVRRSIEVTGRTGAGFAPDQQAWNEAKKLIDERSRLRVPQTGRTWTREELCDERLERYSRRH